VVETVLSESLFFLADASLSELEKLGIDPSKHEEFACYAILSALVHPVGIAVQDWLALRRAVNGAPASALRVKNNENAAKSR
jgi:hypothetical protein